ncbi:MAG: serine/threonine protein kinase, partial [Anaerolineae bacterium]
MMSEGTNATRHIQDEQDTQRALSVPDGSLQPGQELQGRYRILGIIGMGGMGAVYQARDMRFDQVQRLCAVKEVINMAKDQNLREQTMSQFQREAELLATLDHPAVPKIYDFFAFGDRAYLVMEFIQGKDLEAIMNSTDGLLPVDKIKRWAIEVCDVLHYLHSYKPEPIIFRDMKPSNVMIDHHDRVRLIDFGIAKTFQMGQPGTMIGTEGYSPPEQYKGVATPAADIYALGATMHQLLTGRDPRLEPPLSFDQAPVRNFRPDIPQELEAIVMRALSYEPKERYASASAMRQSLEASPPFPENAMVPAQQPPQQHP